MIDAKSQTYAVEVKRAEDSGKVHDGVIQTYNYWRDLVDGNAEYTARGKGLDIDAVLLATEHAPKGRLFHDWQKKIQNGADGRTEHRERLTRVIYRILNTQRQRRPSD